jgi:tetratricopeptide (TPR) repeat protein
MKTLTYFNVVPNEPHETYLDRQLANLHNMLVEHPEDKVHLMHVILVYMFDKDPDEIISYAFEVLKEDKEMEYTVEIYLSLARAYIDKNDVNKAIEYYRKIIAIEPDCDEVIMDLGDLYTKQKDIDAALSVYDYLDNDAIEFGKENMNRYKGTLYYNRQEWDKALDCYQRAYEITADDSDGWIAESIGQTYWQMNDYRESSIWFKKALEKNPKSSNAHYGMGLCYQHTDDPYRALHHYFEAIKIKPDFTYAYNNIAAITINVEGEIKQGIEILNKALENNDDKESRSLIYQNLSRVYHRTLQYDLAEHYKREFLKSVGLEGFISKDVEDDEDDDYEDDGDIL